MKAYVHWHIKHCDGIIFGQWIRRLAVEVVSLLGVIRNSLATVCKPDGVFPSCLAISIDKSALKFAFQIS